MPMQILHKMKKVVFFLMLTLASLSANAQQYSIKGLVTDLEKGEGVPFASVFILGTSQGTNTDDSGVFQFSSDQKEGKVVASFLGYRSDTLEWRQGAYLRFVLKPTASSLQEVVVTGTWKEVSKMESPVPVEVYTPKFFLRNPTPSLLEAMQNVNGVRPQLNCSVCNTGDIHINGMEGPYTMILIDGMPIVSGLSTVYGLSGIPNSMIQRVEVVKGPAATVYGSEAVGGLINVITKAPLHAPKMSVDLSSTTYLENNLDLGYSANLGKASTLLSAGYFYFNERWDKNKDNFTDITLQNRLSIFNKWSFERKDNRQANIAFRYVWEERFGGDLRWETQFRGGDSIYGESIYTKRYEALGNYQLPTNEKLMFTYSYNYHDQNSVYGTTIFNAIQQIGFGQLTWDKKLGRHDLLSGLALRYTHYDDNTPITSDAFLNNAPSEIWLPGVFLQDEIAISAKHKIMPGIRYDYSSNNGGIFTPRMSYKFAPNNNNTVRLTYGTGYRVAYVFSEDHAALTGGRDILIKNTLQPERSQNVNLNFVTKFFPGFGFIGLDASVFYTYFNNKIVADYLTDPNKIIFDNLEEYGVSQGVTLNSEFNFTNGLKIMAGFTAMDVFTKAKDSLGIHQKVPQLQAPNLTANWSVSYTLPKINLTIDYTGYLNSPMYLPVQENDFRPDQSPWFSIQNIQLTKTFKGGIAIYGGVKNLLNFVPKDPILRPFDPFDKDIANNNPNGYTFDPTYSYAAVQGIRGFLGVRMNIKK
jgi:outer membrane receptor for ferrienterochelin and colicins